MEKIKSEMQPSKCYICDEIINTYGTDLFIDITLHSGELIFEVLEKVIGRPILRTSENNVGCMECIQKINDYDFACLTAKKVQTELIELLNQTEERYIQNVVLVSDDESTSFGFNAQGKHSLIGREREIKNEKSPDNTEEDADEYEVLLFENEEDSGEKSEIEEISDNEYETIYEITTDEIINNNNNNNTENGSSPIRQNPKTRRPRTSKCVVCKIDFSSIQDLHEHQKIHDTEKLVCDICGMSYKTQTGLKIHVGMHNGISPFKCEVCGKKFTQKGALKRHKPMHTGEKPYQCDKCGKRFIHYSSFHMHNLAHDDIRDKKCEICGLLLRSTSHLKRHMLVHTGQKPHACPKCGQRFAQRYNMMSHLRSHQGIHRKKKTTPKDEPQPTLNSPNKIN